ncbi:UNVERIFIED_CONTAM: hypothetical protein HDU68_011542 [Siphonaria sp. JEL0065]|nr:hypothetical protein HDU68_011542 [Siphonaria sp. JEL0065]
MEPEYIPLLVVSSALLFLSMVGFLVLAWFVLYVETYKRGLPMTWQSIANAYNKLLAQMSISLIGIYICQVIRYADMSLVGNVRSFSRKANDLAFNILTALFEVAYCLYSFRRTSPVVELIYPLLVVKITRLLRVLPVLFILQVIPTIVELGLFSIASPQDVKKIKIAMYSLNALTGLVTLILDAILLTTFIRFLHSTRHDEVITIDSRFLIIARYGVCIVVTGFAAIIVYLLYAVATLETYLLGTLGLFSIVFWGLLGMKMALFYDDVKRGQANQSRLERALGKDELRSIKATSMMRMLSVRTEQKSSIQASASSINVAL